MTTKAQPDAKRSAIELSVDVVLFDADGTLIDSIAAVEHAWQEWADEEALELPHCGLLHGLTATDLVASLLPAHRVPAAVARLAKLEQNPRLPIAPLPGACELIAAMSPDQWAIVTSASRPAAIARLTAAGIPLPSRMVTGDDVARGKPAPDPYLAGRRHAGVAIAFEDTSVGLDSARAAGCIAVGVSETTNADELRAHSDAVIASLSDVTVMKSTNHNLRLRLEVSTV